MTRFGNIYYLCLAFGALWGAIITVFVTLLALFISGHPFQPQVTAGSVAGLVTAALLTGVAPEGRSIGMVLLAALVFVVVLTIASGAGREPRYNVEVLCLRFLKGFGIVVFTIAVALPFFVMVMMSLKNQQLLLSNPLDFSLNFSQGAAALFRSYIELFT